MHRSRDLLRLTAGLGLGPAGIQTAGSSGLAQDDLAGNFFALKSVGAAAAGRAWAPSHKRVTASHAEGFLTFGGHYS